MINLNDNIWMGLVEDNKDPKQIGRIKVRVFGLFEEFYH